jgi:OOP family OmpA-OmpF porin
LRETTQSRTSVRLDIRDHFAKFNSPLPNEANYNASNIVVSVGVSFEFGGDSHKDTDADGVIDKQDACKGTAIGVVVDGVGCPIDSDGDKVFDGPDLCDGTPAGAVVDSLGCPIDSDGDKIFDGLDSCADTPIGAVVDAKGCPLDTDNDKVFDGLDRCPTTPTAVLVDEYGCPRIDSDAERSFYETGKIVLPDIEFESGKAELLPQGRASLELIGNVIRKWPEITIEVGGHTDNRGSAARNVQLSQERAQAVLDYLTQRYRHIRPEQLSAKGYGPEQPLADNNTEEGRKLNRRVEFTILSGKPEIR